MSVRFRYRLSGFDSDWQDAGTKRQASYTNLPPGHYKFQVVALDNQGSFDPSGAVMTFSIAPAFYQTSWFAVGVAAAILALGAAAWRLRVRQIRERFSLVDDHRIVREGIAALIGQQPDMEVAGAAGTGEEALVLFRRLHPDVVLMDLQLPGQSGLDTIRAIKREDEEARLEERRSHKILSARELEVLELIARVMRNKEIAAELDISEETVVVHVRHLFAKLRVNDRTAALGVAVRRGLIHLQ